MARLTGLLLAEGVLVHERGLMFVSAAHTDADVDQTVAAFDRERRGARAALPGEEGAADG